jgi:hypothetical protein
MIDFEIVIDGETKYLSWAKLCQFTGVKRYQPGTPELAQLKREFEKKCDMRSFDSNRYYSRNAGV